MKSHNDKALLKVLAAVMFVATFAGFETSYAVYRADSDTGAGRLDIIENMRRVARENEPTAEQKKLLGEMKDMYGKLNKPYDPFNPPEGEQVPTAFEGDDLTYDQITGEFVAKGKVHIVQLDGHSFDAPGDEGEITGNTRRQEINIDGKAQVLQYPIKKGEQLSKITVEGYRTRYNYGTKMGTMESAKGKVDRQYITGKRFEFYPNRVVVYDGTVTRCSANKPDYHESAKKIIIWPNDRMYLYDVKVWIGNAVLYKKKYMEKDISPGAENVEYPRVGYSKSDGFWIKQRVNTPLIPRINLLTDLYANTKQGVRSKTELAWAIPHYTAKVAYGFYEDGDDNWIKKKPSFITQYNNHFGGLPLSYVVRYESGHWEKVRSSGNNFESTHTEYNFELNHDIIVLPANYFLLMGVGYQIVKETYNDSTNKGFSYGTTLLKWFDERWAAYTGYNYSRVNANNSLFDYNTADYSQRGEAGVSYRLTKNDRFVAGVGYDLKTGHLRDVDYYWFHDLHCSQVILRYSPKKHKWHIDWQFLPW